jgi:hypothetical protein
MLLHLREGRGRLTYGDVYHFQHGQFAERLESLHMYLAGALALTEQDLYMPTFGLLRSALEHHVQDHLLFLANRYKVTIEDVSDDKLRDWQAAIDEGRAGFEDILEVRRVGQDTAEVVRSGPHFTEGGKGPDAPSLSSYYLVMFEQFDPFTGGRRAQDYIGDWPYRDETRRRWAASAAKTWRTKLTWQQLTENLRLNGFYTDSELARWYVHFSFLSAFTHPSPRAVEAIYGHNSPKRYGYDHFASELALLYIITVARLELEIFEEMSGREPKVGLDGWDDVRQDIVISKAIASHLWFPTGSPLVRPGPASELSGDEKGSVARIVG